MARRGAPLRTISTCPQSPCASEEIEMPASGVLEIRGNLRTTYADVFTREAMSALHALAPLDADRKTVMAARIARRAARARNRQRIGFLDPAGDIPRTRIKVQDARDGAFAGSEIPSDLRRQWIQ